MPVGQLPALRCSSYEYIGLSPDFVSPGFCPHYPWLTFMSAYWPLVAHSYGCVYIEGDIKWRRCVFCTKVVVLLSRSHNVACLINGKDESNNGPPKSLYAVQSQMKMLMHNEQLV